jgi:threonine 3-dehydrogenase
MRAARFLGSGRIEVAERPVPRPGRGEVLVRVHSCALCGTDRHGYLNGAPVTPGHETSGVVVGIGAGAPEELLGARGVVYLVDFCGVCVVCRRGAVNMCRNKRRMYGFTADGGYADYVAVGAACFLPVDEDIPLDEATMLLDALGTTGHALRRAGGAPRHIAIIGAGPIGLGAVVVAKAHGAAEIVVIDVSAYRLGLARRLGASAVDARAGDPVATALELRPEGFDVVIEAAGLTLTQRQAVALATPGGTVVFVAHNAEPLEVETLIDLIQQEKTLMGSEYFPLSELPQTLALLRRAGIDAGTLITHRFPLDEIAGAFGQFMSGESGKVLVQP